MQTALFKAHCYVCLASLAIPWEDSDSLHFPQGYLHKILEFLGGKEYFDAVLHDHHLHTDDLPKKKV